MREFWRSLRQGRDRHDDERVGGETVGVAGAVAVPDYYPLGTLVVEGFSLLLDATPEVLAPSVRDGVVAALGVRDAVGRSTTAPGETEPLEREAGVLARLHHVVPPLHLRHEPDEVCAVQLRVRLILGQEVLREPLLEALSDLPVCGDDAHAQLLVADVRDLLPVLGNHDCLCVRNCSPRDLGNDAVA